LAADLPPLWTAPTTSDKERKRLLRTPVADVTPTSQASGDEVRIGVRWRSGASELLAARRPPPPYEANRTPNSAVELIAQGVHS